MSVGPASVWEVRPATGSNLNGAGFDSTISGAGTDYTQQAAAQASWTNLACTTTALTDAGSTGLFTAAMVGNAIHIESGTNYTPGFYFIVAFVNSNAVTLDRTPVSGVGASGAGKVGGATASISGQTTTTLGASVAPGNIVHIKNEAWNEAAVFTVAGTNPLPICVIGYNNTRLDMPTDGSRPNNNRAGAGAVGITATTGYIFRSLVVTSAGSSGWSIDDVTQLYNCRATTCTTNGVAIAASANVTLLNCEFDTNTTNGVSGTSGQLGIYGSYIHGNSGSGISMTTTAITMADSIVSANAATGVIKTTGPIKISNVTVHGNTGSTSDGVQCTTANGGSYAINCIFSNNGRYGINGTTSIGSVLLVACNFYLNATAATNNSLFSISQTALNPQYVSASTGDFRVGINMRGLAYPAIIPGSLTPSYQDLGASQRVDAGVMGTANEGPMFFIPIV